MKAIFETQIPLAFSDVDNAGILYFARVFDMAHRALEEFARFHKIYDVWFMNPEVAAPIKSTQADYKIPVPLGSTLHLAIRLDKSTEHSLTFQTDFLLFNEVAATVSTVHVFIDKRTKQKCAIPERLRQSLRL